MTKQLTRRIELMEEKIRKLEKIVAQFIGEPVDKEEGQLKRETRHNLRFMRKAAGWTQRELAKALDVSQSVICNVENGKVAHINYPMIEEAVKLLEHDYQVEMQRREAVARHAASIKARRERLGWSKRSLALFAGVYPSDLGRFEAGLNLKPKVEMLNKVTEALNVLEKRQAA